VHILFLCGREVNYPFNFTMLQALRRLGGVDVVAEEGMGTSITRRSLQVMTQGLPHLLSRRYDLVYVGFYGYLLMLPVGLLARQPVLFNPFISTYETLVLERKRFREASLGARLAFWLDQVACRGADRLILDTQAHVDYFVQQYHLPRDKFDVVYVGADETVFYPRPEVSEEPVVLYHGAYLPVHGVETIVRAAGLLDGKSPLRFRLIGEGLEYRQARDLAEELDVSNVEFLPPQPWPQMPGQIARASICLGGHFGTAGKAGRVIAGKTYQYLAMGKATIVGDNAANRELLAHGQDAWFCPMADPKGLADGIQALAKDSDLRECLGQKARGTFLKRASTPAINERIRQVVEALVKN
jgi:glycosyltransferase involved in cell wall biosynthesis